MQQQSSTSCNPGKITKASNLRQLELLITFSFVDDLDFITKIRLLNKKTRKLTENSFIVKEGRKTVLKSQDCWLCRYSPVHLRAVTAPTDTLVIYIDEFVKKSCEGRHSPYKQLRTLMESLCPRFRDRKVICMYHCEPDQTFCSRLSILAEISAIQTRFVFKQTCHYDFDGVDWGYFPYDCPSKRRC